MGANQIGFLVKGPRTLKNDAATLTRTAEAVTASLAVLRTCNDAYDAHNGDLSDKMFGEVDFSTTPHLDAATVECYLPVALPTASPREIIKDFVTFWRTENARDVATRVDPDDSDQILMFAGEMTWGDPPRKARGTRSSSAGCCSGCGTCSRSGSRLHRHRPDHQMQ